jgi:pyruvate-ferredoxin/flavodoxin oxidoreductase
MQHQQVSPMKDKVTPQGARPGPRFPGIRITTNGNQLVAYHTEARITEGGVFYPITPSTEMGENYQLAFAEGKLDVFGNSKIAIEAEGEHAAQGGAIAFSVCGKRTVNFTSGQGIVYGAEQYYHAPGKLSTMVLEVAARALTKHALNVHCGHDDINAVLDTGWIMLFAKDAQQAADQALVLRKVTELTLTPGMNIQDGFLTSHLERTFYKHESELLREYLGAPGDLIDCPTAAQKVLFGPKRRRVPSMIDLKRPLMLGPVQNQEHYMNGVIARRDNFYEDVLPFLEKAWKELGDLTGRHYGPISHYKTEDAETVFVALGSAAENIEAAIDLLRSRGEKVGCIHPNVLRPFPEAAIVEALRGKKNCIILERTDEPLAGDNPLARDIRTALSKGLQNHAHPACDGVPPLAPAQVPRLFGGVYGLGSRDFRPEGILGAYEFATKGAARQDGKKASDGEHYFAVGIDHPYAVKSKERPSLLPHGAIAVRFHSIGGWGMITTGKNLGEILGELGDWVSQERNELDEAGRVKEIVHVSANPKYGSEKKGAPTEYFLVCAPERIRVNCDLRHVTVVLCCDPKAFLHTNPLEGLEPGGAFLWESDQTPEAAWERIPMRYRKEIVEKDYQVWILPGFDIAQKASKRADLQLRMQGNAFLGAFFRVSPFLTEFGIDREHFEEVVRKQYQKKFGRQGQAVIESNMEVMKQGFERCQQVPHGAYDAKDRSTMKGSPLLPLAPTNGNGSHGNGHNGHSGNGCGSGGVDYAKAYLQSAFTEGKGACTQPERAPIHRLKTFDDEFRSGHPYHQPASTLASVGMMAPATGAGSTKFMARRMTPVFNPENCTQCMECIASCPDTALPNTAQDVALVLKTAVANYVGDPKDRTALLAALPAIEKNARAAMVANVASKALVPFAEIVAKELESVATASPAGKEQLLAIVRQLPLAYAKTAAIFASPEKKSPGAGGLFSIFVSDLCKGCGECVTECGDHRALTMAVETEEVNAHHAAGTAFFDLLPDTPQKYLGLYDDQNAAGSREAALRNHLMVRRNYEALVSGDGACAGCGEKSVLRALASVNEAYMRPVFHKKADRFDAKAARLRKEGVERLAALRTKAPAEHALFAKAVAHLLMGLGGEDDQDTKALQAARPAPTDQELVEAIAAVLAQEAFNHKHLQPLDGRLDNGMSAMAMAAHTGCNTVFGSTPPSNPHPYPWMNSLFQDGSTIGWLMGESFIMDHGRRSVIPERLCDALLQGDTGVSNVSVISEREYFELTHFSDALMTDQEILELPKVWVVGGDGGMGDIGYQNVSKVVLQNRPNVKLVMLDTQVYSNTGGQNSDSSLMPGGYDMNQIGAATQGKLTEKKGVAESFTMGHGSAYVAQVSMANAAKLYKSMLDALEYRGTAFLQCYTACQPEHGVADDMSTVEAQRVRDARVMPEFTFHPGRGETRQESFDLKGNPDLTRDWWESKFKSTGQSYRFTPAHFALGEQRFRRHWKEVKDEAEARKLVHLDDMLARATQDDVVRRRHLVPSHRAYVPDFGVVIQFEDDEQKLRWAALSRQLVIFCVERRKSWRMLQSGGGIENLDYRAQKNVLAKVDKGEIPAASWEVVKAEHERLLAEKKKPAPPAAAAAAAAPKA